MKTLDFSETIAACDLKLIEFIKICEYHFLTLIQGHLHMKLEFVLSVTTGPFSAKF